jgi:hypothetical protein
VIRTVFFLALIALALLAQGCRPQQDPQARPVPEAVDEGGWPLYEQPADGFAMALPPGWTALQLGPKTLDQTLEQGLRSNPDLKAREQSIRQQVAAGLKFLGLEKAQGGPNVSVFRTPLKGEVSLDLAAAEMLKEYEAMPTLERPIGRKRVRLKAGEAERFDVVMPVGVPGKGRERLAVTSYVLVRGQALYILTFTAAVGEVARYRPTFERVADSFHLLDK